MGKGWGTASWLFSSVCCSVRAVFKMLDRDAAFARSYIGGLCIFCHDDFLLGEWNPQDNLMAVPLFLKADALWAHLWASVLLWGAKVQASRRSFSGKAQFFQQHRELMGNLCSLEVFPALCIGLQPILGKSTAENCNLNSTYRNEAVEEWERSKIMNERRGTTVNHDDYNSALIRFLHEIL